MRNFIRHPACIPIDISIVQAAAVAAAHATEPGPTTQQTRAESLPGSPTLADIAAGGLSFQLSQAVAVGTQLTISMPHVWPDYCARGTVVWCRSTASGYLAGVEFGEANEAFKARMVAQFCQIENYRQRVRQRDGRHLSSEMAAQEWIERFAEEFANTIGWQQ